MTLSMEQRAARRHRVGASEVGALLDPPCHPFITAQDIYARLMEGVETEVNHAMTIGQLAEPHVLDMARRYYGLKAIACTRAYVHPELPLAASPDAYIRDGEGLVEVKTTSSNWVDQPPLHVIAQVQCQLWLTRRSYAHVVVWQGSRLRLFTVEREEELITDIGRGVHRFWASHLRPGRPPIAEPTSHDFSLENIRA